MFHVTVLSNILSVFLQPLRAGTQMWLLLQRVACFKKQKTKKEVWKSNSEMAERNKMSLFLLPVTRRQGPHTEQSVTAD